MTFSQAIEFNLGGQEVLFNDETKVLILNIVEPFYTAGKILSWSKELGTAGFGINKEILKFVIERRLKLLIRCDRSEQKEYWINFDGLVYFLKTANTEYFTHGMWLHLFPWKLFHSKPVFPIAL